MITFRSPNEIQLWVSSIVASMQGSAIREPRMIVPLGGSSESESPSARALDLADKIVEGFRCRLEGAGEITIAKPKPGSH